MKRTLHYAGTRLFGATSDRVVKKFLLDRGKKLDFNM
jgi:hypothetical protein